MKRTVKRILPLVLALILTTQMFGIAYAGSYSWYDNYYHYTASINTGSSGTKSVYVGASTTHTQGTQTTFYATTSKTVTCTWSGTFPSAYNTQLTKALNNTGLYKTASYSVVGGSSSVIIPKGLASGTYYLNARFSGYSGTYTITTASIMSLSSVDPAATATDLTGSFSFAPNGSCSLIASTTKGS